MAEVILMPRLSDTMTEGVIASWNKNVGDVVKKGDVLAENLLILLNCQKS
jgi:pyruvate dehydrogenase E2 component (dihydrolipoamide acetyltransferase)